MTPNMELHCDRGCEWYDILIYFVVLSKQASHSERSETPHVSAIPDVTSSFIKVCCHAVLRWAAYSPVYCIWEGFPLALKCVLISLQVSEAKRITGCIPGGNTYIGYCASCVRMRKLSSPSTFYVGFDVTLICISIKHPRFRESHLERDNFINKCSPKNQRRYKSRLHSRTKAPSEMIIVLCGERWQLYLGDKIYYKS